MSQPTKASLKALSRLSLGWSMSTGHAAGSLQAASRLYLMTIDLLDCHFIEEHDLAATSALYKSLCKKMEGTPCQCCNSPLVSCPKLDIY